MKPDQQSTILAISLTIAWQAYQIADESVAIAAGAANTFKDFVILAKPILNALGTGVGAKGDTSLILDTNTTLLQEVDPYTPDANMVTGDYWVDYVVGRGRCKKGDTGTSVVADYLVPIVYTHP